MPPHFSETQLAHDLADLTPGDEWNARRDIIKALHDAPGAYAEILARVRIDLGYTAWTAGAATEDNTVYPTWRDRVNAYRAQGLIN